MYEKEQFESVIIVLLALKFKSPGLAKRFKQTSFSIRHFLSNNETIIYLFCIDTNRNKNQGLGRSDVAIFFLNCDLSLSRAQLRSLVLRNEERRFRSERCTGDKAMQDTSDVSG